MEIDRIIDTAGACRHYTSIVDSKRQRQNHVSGKLVVLALIGLGLLLGLIALPFRKLTPKQPATQPVTQPLTAPSGGPVSGPA